MTDHPNISSTVYRRCKAKTSESMAAVEARGQNLVHLQQFGTVYAQ